MIPASYQGGIMKKTIAILSALLIVVSVSASAFAAYEPNVDYLAKMIDAAVIGDYEAGHEAEALRNEKIADLGLESVIINFDEMMLLSKIMYAEAGSAWLSDEWKMRVGEVVLNRVASPEFPNTIAEVLAQPGQYYGSNSRYFNNLLPSRTCVLLAIRLLQGERLMDPSVVFQANFKQGSGTHTAAYDKYLGWTYFCFSSKPELYASVEVLAEASAEEEAPQPDEIEEIDEIVEEELTDAA